MTDKQLEEAAWDYAIEHEWVYDSQWTIIKDAVLFGAAYQLKRMRCGECRYYGTGEHTAGRCLSIKSSVAFVKESFGCIHFEDKEG